MQDRGLAALAGSIFRNPRLASTLVDLDLSSNGIGARPTLS